MIWFILGTLVGMSVCYLYVRSGILNLRVQLSNRRTYLNQAPIKQPFHDPALNALISELNGLIREYDESRASNARMLHQIQETMTSIAHDFRTPLTSMLGYIQIVQENCTDPKDKQRLDIIEQRIKILNNHVEGFYTLNQLASNEYPFKAVHTNPIFLLQEHLAAYYDSIQEVFHSISLNIEERDLTVKLDPYALTRVFENLTKNALRHGSETFSVSTQATPNTLTITFENGGIKESLDVDRIFDRTFSDSNNPHSSGLGLNIARQLCQAMGLTLNAAIQDQRITFTLTIPIKEC